MTDGEKLVLILLLRDGPTSAWDMGYKLGYRPRTGFARISESAYNATRDLLNAWVRRGAVIHSYNSWSITEPGRVQAAVLMAADPSLARVHAHEQP